MPVATYYFDGSDAAATDPSAVWTDETNADDGSTVTYASVASSGSVSVNFILIEGTDSPASGDGIIRVRARVYGGSNLDGGNYGSYYTLTTPTGGWTWAVLQALEVKIFWQNDIGEDTVEAAMYTNGLGQFVGQAAFDANNAATEFRVYRIEIEVTTDAGLAWLRA